MIVKARHLCEHLQQEGERLELVAFTSDPLHTPQQQFAVSESRHILQVSPLEPQMTSRQVLQ